MKFDDDLFDSLRPPIRGEQLIRKFLESIEEDPDREGLRETPHRVMAAWVDYFTAGYSQHPAEVLKQFSDGAEGYDALVLQTAIPYYSMCEHHLLPFFGYAHVAYIPNGKIVGLSKLARLVEIFARRVTVQERICSQIADALVDNLNPNGVGVVLQARHLCMESRGVEKPGTVTVTSALRGAFKTEPELRAEFMSLVNNAMQGMKVL